MKFHTVYSPPPKGGLFFKNPSLTRQEFLKEADIGTLVTRFTKTGSFHDPLAPKPPGTPMTPEFIDNTSIPSLEQTQEIIANASRFFSSLPLKTQVRFGNLTAFVSHLSTPAGVEEFKDYFEPPKSDEKQPDLPGMEPPRTPVPGNSGGVSPPGGSPATPPAIELPKIEQK